MVLLRCPPDQLQQQGQEVLTKFSDLVVKCLIKLTKALQSTLDVGFRNLRASAFLCIPACDGVIDVDVTNCPSAHCVLSACLSVFGVDGHLSIPVSVCWC